MAFLPSLTPFEPQPFWHARIPALFCLVSRQEVILELARDSKERQSLDKPFGIS